MKYSAADHLRLTIGEMMVDQLKAKGCHEAAQKLRATIDKEKAKLFDTLFVCCLCNGDVDPDEPYVGEGDQISHSHCAQDC